MQYCQNCKKPLPVEPASFCPNCGTATNQQKESFSGPKNEFDKIVSNKDPFIAAILSVIFPGLGQVYNGEFNKGLLIQVAFLISIFIGSLFFLILPIPLAILVIGIYDAYNEADKMRKGRTELKNPTFKETLIFILWPFILAGALIILITIFIIIIIIAAVAISIPLVVHGI